MKKLSKITLNINGADRMFLCDPEKDTLATVIRRLGLTGTKVGCGTGVCGSCSVLLEGKVVRSCTKKMKTVKEYSKVLTIEGIGAPNYLHPLQVAFMNHGAVQCGFCSPGFIVSACGLLLENPNPTREDVRDWFQKHRNVCRCTGYKQIVNAVMEAAKVMRGECSIDDIKVKLPENKEYYGLPLVRPAALAKVCGVCDYGDDIELKMPESTLHVVMVQPKVAHHAKILKIHTEEAEKMPGVYKIITHKDVKGSNRLNFFQCSPRSLATEQTHILLAEEKIFNYGDVVAMIAADTKEHAREAAAKVIIDFEQLPGNGANARCCGYGGQPGIANPEFAKFVTGKRISGSDNPYITYCINCRDVFTEAGKEAVHILDILFGGGSEPGKQATVTERRENRIRLKRSLLKMFCWVEYKRASDTESYELINAYAHRMKIELEPVWKGIKVDREL